MFRQFLTLRADISFSSDTKKLFLRSRKQISDNFSKIEPPHHPSLVTHTDAWQVNGSLRVQMIGLHGLKDFAICIHVNYMQVPSLAQG